MKQKILYVISMVLLATAFFSCNDSEGSFDNKIYINASAMTSTILLQGNDADVARFQVVMPKTETKDVTFAVNAESSLLATYNEAYYDNAIILPSANYTIENSQVVISAGTVRSSDIVVSFSGLTDLDRQQKYVLPVTINNANIDVLESARTMYYVIRGAALINVAADINENNAYVDWADPSKFTAMRTFTAEALIYPRAFDNTLSTVMGIEGGFLIRIGDAGIPPNQLQIATSAGNHTNANLAIPTNEWTHIAVTYDADATTINVYINGRNMYNSTTANAGTVNWGVPHSDESDGKPRCFWIGYAYDNNRYLNGLISECRIWERVLTESEIKADNHFYYVEPTSPDLIAYWKFDDGGGVNIKDHSIYGNNATASGPLIWTAVELPVE